MAKRTGKRKKGHTTVVVVDDHPAVRAGICAALLSVRDIEVVGEATDGEEAVRVCEEFHPDVVIVDLKLPEGDGITDIHRLRTHYPWVRVLALTSYPDEFSAQEAILAGAVGYLVKDAELDSLVTAIRATRKGRMTLPPELSQALVNGTSYSAPNGHVPARSSLTKREKEVLTLLLQGLPNHQIAGRLMITASTVSYHLRRLYTKLGVSTLPELVVETVQRRMMDRNATRNGTLRLVHG